jgi:ubiquitin carboxyl-terminal hydrolase 22/27/51
MAVILDTDSVCALADYGEVLTGADVESRAGAVYCQMCDDFVWDPTLEEMRMRKFGTGSFPSKCRLELELSS